MNIAAYEGKIPDVASIRICSLHFPDSAFDCQFLIDGTRRRKLNRRAVPYDWKTLCSKEEIEQIEARTSFRSGDDIFAYVEERRMAYSDGQTAPRVEHNYSMIDEDSTAPTYISRDAVELVHNIPVGRISPGVNLEEAMQYSRDIYQLILDSKYTQQSEQPDQTPVTDNDLEVVEEHIYTDNLDETSGVFAAEEDVSTSYDETHPEVLNECVTPKDKICRLCGVENATMIAIFDALGRRLNLAEKINAALPIHVSEFDDMPTQICLLCVENVDKMFLFHKKITVTDEKLRVIFNIPDQNANIGKKDILQSMVDDIGIEDEGNDSQSDNEDLATPEEGVSFCEPELDDCDVLLEMDDVNDDAMHMAALEYNKNPANEAEYDPLICSICNTTLRNSEEYIAHQKKHGLKLWHCPICKVFFGNSHMLKYHWFQLHNKSLKMLSSRSAEVQKLVKKFSSSRSNLKCKYCSVTFHYVDEYRSHIINELRLLRQSRKEEEPANIKCEYCDLMFHTDSQKHYHMLKSHTEYKPFECSICHKRFRIKTSMKMHEDMHREENTALCTVCGRLCTSRAVLRAHMRKHMDPVRCEICDKSMIPDRLKSHMKIHKLGRPLKCPHCPSVFRLSRNLKHHVETHTESRFSCNLCSYSTKRKLIMHSHMRRMHAIEVGEGLMCSIEDCGQVVSSASQLYEHIRAKHDDIEPLPKPMEKGVNSFFCSYCRSIFSTPATYASHMRHDHTEVKNVIFTCAVCMVHFGTQNELVDHLEIHPESQRFQCRHCPRKFVTTSKRRVHEHSDHSKEWLRCAQCFQKVTPEQFEAHLALHKHGKTFDCDLCSRKFYDFKSYSGHMKSHVKRSTDGSLSCQYCSKIFSNKQLLGWHENLHTAPNVYECESCDYACTSKKSIRLHRKTKHVENIVEEMEVAPTSSHQQYAVYFNL